MNELQLSDFLVLVAAGMFVLGYLIIDQALLRIMLLIGTAFYVWYYAVVDDTPLWPAIWASVATGTANLVGLLNLFYRNSTLAIPRRFRDIYVHFNILPPGDFRKLMLASQRVVRPAGYLLTEEEARVNTLYYVVDGSVELEKFGGRFRIPDNTFVGEVAYLTGNRASATTRTTCESDVLEWDIAMLRRRARKDPRFRLAMDAMISLDLAGKVARAGSPSNDEQDGNTTELSAGTATYGISN